MRYRRFCHMYLFFSFFFQHTNELNEFPNEKPFGYPESLLFSLGDFHELQPLSLYCQVNY